MRLPKLSRDEASEGRLELRSDEVSKLLDWHLELASEESLDEVCLAAWCLCLDLE